ncbi:glycosyltransferase family 4 protein [Wenyingzhuangia sp. IMCC45574]
MKILTIGNYNGNLSLYEAQLKQFIIMHHRGIDVTIQGHFSDEIKSILLENNVPYIEDRAKSKNDKLFADRLKKTVVNNQFDIVHVFGGAYTSNTCKALKKVKVKIIGYMGSTSIHWHDPLAYRTYLNFRLDKIISISKDITRHLKKQLFKKNKVITIYKGYNTDWFNNTTPFDYSELGIPKNAIIILSAAHHRPVKGMKYLMKATNYIQNTKDVYFVFVGKNTDSEDLKKLASKSKLKNKILQLGLRSDIKNLMMGAHIYTQTSKNEGLGRAIIESMCLKKPVVVTNAGGCTELVDNGVSGYIADNKNPKSIAEKLNLLIKSKENREKFGIEGYKRVQNIFDIETTVDKTIALYQSILN